MKFKKLLAAVTAAALAVTTMAVASFTASAADETTAHTLYQFVASAPSVPTSYKFDRSAVDWSGASTSITVKVYGEQAAGSGFYGIYLNETTTWTGTDATAVDGDGFKSITVDGTTGSTKEEQDTVANGALAAFKNATEYKLV